MAVLVIVFLWQWLDGHRAISDMQQQLAKKIAEMDGNSKATQVLLAQDQDQVRELSAKVATMESRYAESQNQRVALENLYNNLSANSDEAALAEVEQMLMIASQQLQLSANVRAALIAMQTADSRLQRMNRPAFSGLRQAINNDMDKLRALHEADITGINLQLNNLISAVDSMPLAYQQQLPANQAAAQPASPEAGTAWQKLLHDIWNELKQLVRIENTDTGRDSAAAAQPGILPARESEAEPAVGAPGLAVARRGQFQAWAENRATLDCALFRRKIGREQTCVRGIEETGRVRHQHRIARHRRQFAGGAQLSPDARERAGGFRGTVQHARGEYRETSEGIRGRSGEAAEIAQS